MIYIRLPLRSLTFEGSLFLIWAQLNFSSPYENINKLSNSVTTNSSEPDIFVRYNGVRYKRVNLCSKMTDLPIKSVRYNRVFVNNRVHFNRVSLYFTLI